MPLLNLDRFKGPVIIPIIFTLILLIGSDDSFGEPNPQKLADEFSELIETHQKENQELLEAWNDYLIKVKGYTNADYMMVIEDLTNRFGDLFVELNQKIDDYQKNDEEQYNSLWMKDIADKFGKEFVCNNRKAIIDNLWVAFNRNESKRYDTIGKELIYREVVLYGSYQEYLTAFMNFYGGLDEQKRSKIKDIKGMVERYLELTKTYHFANIYNSTFVKFKLIEIQAQKNKELFMFLKERNYPYGNSVAMRAARDLDMFIEVNQ